LQYIGPSRNDSHSQTFVEILQKGSNLKLYSKESNPKAENGIHENFDAYFECLYKQAHKNIAIENGTILVNKEGQPMGIRLTNNFIVLIMIASTDFYKNLTEKH
jgi:hypothetical protein